MLATLSRPDLSPKDPETSALRAIAARYLSKARALGVKKPRTGSIGVVHRFSSDLRCNVHLHDLWLDGVYADGGAFTPIAPPDRAEMAKLLLVIVKRIARLFVLERGRLRPLLDAFGYREDPLPMAKARAPPQFDFDFRP